MRYAYSYVSPIGKIYIAECDGFISHILRERQPPDTMICETPLINRAAGQLREYFEGSRTQFDLPLNPEGTPFQQAVWRALMEIPFGETRSYSQIAELVGCTGGSRAVGMANNKNPLLIVVPCHRVIGCNGRMVGYSEGVRVKEFLLRMEHSLLLQRAALADIE